MPYGNHNGTVCRQVQCTFTRVCKYWQRIARLPESHSCLPRWIPNYTEVSSDMRRLYSKLGKDIRVGRNCLGLVPLHAERLTGVVYRTDAHIQSVRAFSKLVSFEMSLDYNTNWYDMVWQFYSDLTHEKPHLKRVRATVYACAQTLNVPNLYLVKKKLPVPSSHLPLLQIAETGVELCIHLNISLCVCATHIGCFPLGRLSKHCKYWILR